MYKKLSKLTTNQLVRVFQKVGKTCPDCISKKEMILLLMHQHLFLPVENMNFDPKQLKLGIKTELEHTKSRKIAETIAMHHLHEDPIYYTKLLKAKL